ncbi:hypothetical protein BDA96_03G062600 [Sorghum bicolor]|uniref:Uncharacterized protein n=2 Tax=Sorghum bicolor TaxID=4558 RepID=A0A921R9J8_SORBI|nr:uncharacterized protein LOC8075100 [Sorghum bicolor]EES00260.1 hypothetical protein SORBI_3003G058300 [Sorghum bicolor]KAG0536423.1 hypothetical protein BDA96_03G062600 [Sorghum bicolor]|eukprot:XP_002455140.1 uncharacterized protein LOC8075100 [Sorghum bicolor]
MASNFVPDAWAWITSLPPFTQWRTSAMSLCICATPSASAQPSMNLSVVKTPSIPQPSYVTFSIFANYSVPVSLWTSKPVHLKTKTQQTLDEQDMIQVFVDIVNSVMRYCPDKKLSFRFPGAQPHANFKDVFNIVFLSLAFLVCIYEAPRDLRPGCLDSLRTQLTGSKCRDAAKNLVKMLGANLEDQWMQTMNLAVTNWIVELRSANQSSGVYSPLFSYALSASGLWKVQLYCPVIAMGMEEPAEATQDERLLFSLIYQQVECVIQLAYRTARRDNWIDVEVKVDNIRCDVDSLVSETLMAERGYGSEEKHFPSRVMLQITPMQQSDVLSVSVGKSNDNPTHEFGIEKGFEGSFDPPNSFGLKASVTESLTLAMKPWKFEQSVHGNTATLNWFLHDGINGREVYSSKPSKLSLLQPRAWFRDRYSNAYRPFTKQGGVIFARDEYGDSVWWKICGATLGKTMNWEIRGWIWLTYWPNKQRTFHSETRWLEFRECLQLPLTKFP